MRQCAKKLVERKLQAAADLRCLDYVDVDLSGANLTVIFTKDDGCTLKSLELYSPIRIGDDLDTICNTFIVKLDEWLYNREAKEYEEVPELTREEIESLGKSQPNRARDVVLMIEDALLNSNLEWGFTYDPKTKSYTVSIAEVEI